MVDAKLRRMKEEARKESVLGAQSSRLWARVLFGRPREFPRAWRTSVGKNRRFQEARVAPKVATKRDPASTVCELGARTANAASPTVRLCFAQDETADRRAGRS